MVVKVVDASALGALLFGEPDGNRVAKLLEGVVLIAPALLDFEIVNVCLKKIRRHPGQRDALLSAFAAHADMLIEIVEVDHKGVLELADESGLTAYDASYLWLARKANAELVTLDKKLSQAHQTS